MIYSFTYYKVDFALFRDKINNLDKKIEFLTIFMTETKKFNIKSFISSDIKLAIKFNSYGIHLNSQQFSFIDKVKKYGFKTIISCHTREEAKKAYKKTDFITYSPIFHSPNKGIPKGIDELKYVVENINPNTIALGGIVTEDEIKQIRNSGAIGFASIRYFQI